jgi:hypothetical protein
MSAAGTAPQLVDVQATSGVADRRAHQARLLHRRVEFPRHPDPLATIRAMADASALLVLVAAG